MHATVCFGLVHGYIGWYSTEAAMALMRAGGKVSSNFPPSARMSAMAASVEYQPM